MSESNNTNNNIWYHGSLSRFTRFANMQSAALYGAGVYLTAYKPEAEFYADVNGESGDLLEKLAAAHANGELDLTKPFVTYIYTVRVPKSLVIMSSPNVEIHVCGEDYADIETQVSLSRCSPAYASGDYCSNFCDAGECRYADGDCGDCDYCEDAEDCEDCDQCETCGVYLIDELAEYQQRTAGHFEVPGHVAYDALVHNSPVFNRTKNLVVWTGEDLLEIIDVEEKVYSAAEVLDALRRWREDEV